MPDVWKPVKAASAFAADASGAVFDALFRARMLSPASLILAYARLKLRRAWRERILGGRLTSESLFGTRFLFRDHAAFSSMVREIFLRQGYAFRSAHPRPRILDCGGNIGLATYYFKRAYPDARVTVFEPDPDNFRLLDANLLAAGLVDVERVQAALAGRAGELAFARAAGDAEGVNAHLAPALASAASGETLTVRAETLSSRIVGEIDFLKMDIEGAEDEVLREVAAAGKLRNIRALTVEYHHHARRGMDSLGGFLGLLEQQGFGYRLSASDGSPDPEGPQDILIHAWRKEP
jgi:FkbM family methyltransferase